MPSVPKRRNLHIIGAASAALACMHAARLAAAGGAASAEAVLRAVTAASDPDA